MIRMLWARLKVLAGAAILAVLVWRLGTSAFVDGLRVIDAGSVAAALAIGLLTTVLSAWRWCVVARGLGLRLPLPAAVADYYRALLLNAVLPMGVLGDVHRAVSHGKESGDVGKGVRAVVLERTAGQVVLIGAAVAVLFTRPGLVATVAGDLVPFAAGHGVVIAGLSVLGLLATLILAGAVAVLLMPAVAARLRRGTAERGRALATTLADVRSGLLGRRTWPAVVVSSAVTLLGHVTMFVVAARITGSSVPVTRLLPLMVLALLAMGLPVNIGGWGPREAVSALAFGAAGLGAAQGVTIAVVYGILTLVASLPGAAVLLLRRGAAAAGADVRDATRDETREEIHEEIRQVARDGAGEGILRESHDELRAPGRQQPARRLVLDTAA